MLGETREEARQQYDELMDRNIVNETDSKRAELLRQVEREQQTYLREVRMTMGETAVRLASSILTSLAGEDLEHRVLASVCGARWRDRFGGRRYGEDF
jgi:F0F1-type ATP synthase membrane subunit b/b'